MAGGQRQSRRRSWRHRRQKQGFRAAAQSLTFQHGSRIFWAYIKLPITALGWRSLKTSLGTYTFFGLDEVLHVFLAFPQFVILRRDGIHFH